MQIQRHGSQLELRPFLMWPIGARHLACDDGLETWFRRNQHLAKLEIMRVKRKYKPRSLDAAARRVAQLEKQIAERDRIVDRLQAESIALGSLQFR